MQRQWINQNTHNLWTLIFILLSILGFYFILFYFILLFYLTLSYPAIFYSILSHCSLFYLISLYLTLPHFTVFYCSCFSCFDMVSWLINKILLYYFKNGIFIWMHDILVHWYLSEEHSFIHHVAMGDKYPVLKDFLEKICLKREKLCCFVLFSKKFPCLLERSKIKYQRLLSKNSCYGGWVFPDSQSRKHHRNFIYEAVLCFMENTIFCKISLIQFQHGIVASWPKMEDPFWGHVLKKGGDMSIGQWTSKCSSWSDIMSGKGKCWITKLNTSFLCWITYGIFSWNLNHVDIALSYYNLFPC